MAPTVPDTIGGYKILGWIAHGGMGTVYRARDPKIGRDVAVKLLREGLDDEDMRERFLREARSAGALKHGNIVTVFELGEHEGQPFIAMEYVQGETLSALLKRQPGLSLIRKLRIMDQLCSGLHYAHQRGIVHRDVKPANIMIDDDGTVKILDFGIARMGASGMTQAGMMMGTLHYMAPEQMEGKTVDARADIFAVGAVFYELLSLRQAFGGDKLSAVMQQILRASPPPLEEVCPNADPEVIAIVSKCLEKQREDRYQDLAATRRDLLTVRRRLEIAGTDELAGTLPGIVDIPSSATPSSARPSVIADPATPVRSSSRGSVASENLRLRAERIRGEQIQAIVDRGRRALDTGDFETSFGACEQALVIDPENADVRDLEDRTRAVVAQCLAQAREDIRLGALTTASLLIERVLTANADSAEALDLRRLVAEARAFRRAVVDAQRLLTEGSLDAAAETIERALATNPTDVEAVAVKGKIEAAAAHAAAAKRRAEEEARARQAVKEATRLFGAGDHIAACGMLEGLATTHPFVADALVALKNEMREIERRRIEAERLKVEAERRRKEREKKEEEDARRAADADRKQKELERQLAADADRKQRELERQRAADADRKQRELDRQLAADADRKQKELERQLAAEADRKQREQLERQAAAAAPLFKAPPAVLHTNDDVAAIHEQLQGSSVFDDAPTVRRERPAGGKPGVPFGMPPPIAVGPSQLEPGAGGRESSSRVRRVAALVVGAVATVVVVMVVRGLPPRPVEPAAPPADSSTRTRPSTVDQPQAADRVGDQSKTKESPPTSVPVDKATETPPAVIKPTAVIKEPVAQPDIVVAPLNPTPAEKAKPPEKARPTEKPEQSVSREPLEPPALVERYSRARDAVDSGTFSTAVQLLESIQKENSAFRERDVAALLARARDGMSAVATQTQEAARKLEDSGDLVGALREYARLPQIDSSLAAVSQESTNRVRARMKLEGTAAFVQARQFDAVRRVEQAIAAYDRAFRYLPDDDPNKNTARDRRDALLKDKK